MKLSKWILGGVIIAAGVTGALWGTGHLPAIASLDDTNATTRQPAAVLQPPTISVVRPALRAFTERLRVNGSLVAREEVLVAPQIEGQRIGALFAEPGDTVAKGQLLARLATENLDALVAQNDAALLRADANIARAGNAIDQAAAQLKEAAAALKRAKPLSRSGYLSGSTLDQRQAAASAAQAALAIAKDNLRVAESERADTRAKRRELMWRRSRTEIHAPVAGLILSRSAKVGAIATATGEPMFRIAKAAEIELDGEATSDQLHRLSVGQAVRIEVAGQPNLTGKVRLVNPRVDPQTRLGRVRIFIGPNANLRVGTFVSGTVETASGRGLAVPQNAIMRDRDGAYVQIVEDSKVRVRRITTGLASDGFTEVRTGLNASDRVIAKAGTFLGDGEPVTPVEPVETNHNKTHPGPQAKAG
ncbi:MAG: efflux RND transporter periplasmic adaptor subunit [Hyphomicrobiaceae bacterium]